MKTFILQSKLEETAYTLIRIIEYFVQSYLFLDSLAQSRAKNITFLA